MSETLFGASALGIGLPWGLFLFAYLLGSIPFGVIVAKIFHVKGLTSKGSGNIGASNVSRVAGFWPAGFLTFVLDVSKGVIGVLMATPMGIRLISGVESDAGEAGGHLVLWATGFFAVLGHCYSPWMNFKGGKGVATGLGVFFVLSPVSAVCGLLGFVVSFLNRRIASLASITGLILAGVVYTVLHPLGAHCILGAMILFLILMRHEKNIDALLKNQEKPIS